jgi:23S rRNA-/tRNA-specific pseudouridylate synthase
MRRAVDVVAFVAVWWQPAAALEMRSNNPGLVWTAKIPDQSTSLVEQLPTALHRLYPEVFPTISASKKACRRRELYVEDGLSSCSTIVYRGDSIERRQRAGPGSYEINPLLAVSLPVIFEDDFMAVVVKPAGMATHGGSANGLSYRDTSSSRTVLCKQRGLRFPAESSPTIFWTRYEAASFTR